MAVWNPNKNNTTRPRSSVWPGCQVLVVLDFSLGKRGRAFTDISRRRTDVLRFELLAYRKIILASLGTVNLRVSLASGTCSSARTHWPQSFRFAQRLWRRSDRTVALILWSDAARLFSLAVCPRLRSSTHTSRGQLRQEGLTRQPVSSNLLIPTCPSSLVMAISNNPYLLLLCRELCRMYRAGLLHGVVPFSIAAIGVRLKVGVATYTNGCLPYSDRCPIIPTDFAPIFHRTSYGPRPILWVTSIPGKPAPRADHLAFAGLGRPATNPAGLGVHSLILHRVAIWHRATKPKSW